MDYTKIFYRHLAQTSNSPLGIEIVRAHKEFLYDAKDNEYIDLISGISVSSFGHNNKKIIKAIKKQLDNHLHLMVYGEIIQHPQVILAKKLTEILPEELSQIYLVNSGSEAVEGALKLAKRYTGRTEIIACYNAYHGSTHGCLSIMGSEFFKQNFRPLLPDIRFIRFNNRDDLKHISQKTACVIIEPIQSEAGVIAAEQDYIKELREKCNETGCLLIFDECQTGMGRTGKYFAFEHYDVVPDILVLAKAFGGGMPLGAFISKPKIMKTLSYNPPLGHITTFGGHPLSCSAAIAAIEIMTEKKFLSKVREKSELFNKKLANHKNFKFRQAGLLMAIELEKEKSCSKLIKHCLKNNVIVDWFLFAPNCLRIAPPLTISSKSIEKAIDVILSYFD